MTLYLDPLIKAIASFKEALAYAESDLAQNNVGIFKQFRNSVIQCFEFTYEVSWKLAKKQLELILPNSTTIDEMSFQDLMREAAIAGLVKDPGSWMRYRKYRNLTSHAYNENYAQELFLIAKSFLNDAEDLLKNLQDKNK